MSMILPEATRLKLEKYLDRLPEEERITFQLYYQNDLSQKEIALIRNISQGAVSHRIKRAKIRMDFLTRLEELKPEDAFQVLPTYFNALEIEVIKGMFETTCQTETARMVNATLNLVPPNEMNQVKIRHLFEKSIKRMRENQSDLACKKILDILIMIKEGLYILHEVKLPHFNRGPHGPDS